MKVAVASPQPPVRHSPPMGGAVVQRSSAAASSMMVDSDDDNPLPASKPALAHVKLGANQSETHHIVPVAKATLPSRGKFEHLYKDAAGERGARSFAGDRTRQILRWIATVLFTHFPNAVEIQCYWDKDNGRLWISSNKRLENARICEALSQGIGQFEAALMANAYPAGRQHRHAMKLLGRKKYDEQTAIYEALKAKKVLVPSEKLTQGDGKEVDVHAERRIRRAFGKDLDPTCLAGVKRPCLVCARALGITTRSHPGPSWNSTPALYGYTLQDVLDHAIANGVITHVTRDRYTGLLDTGHDTDSGSDVD